MGETCGEESVVDWATSTISVSVSYQLKNAEPSEVCMYIASYCMMGNVI